MVKFRCPQCDQSLKVPGGRQGQTTRCLACGAIFPIPGDASTKEQPRSRAKKNPVADNQGPVPEGQLSRPSKDIDMEELIDMTAMVDIVFFLLIFFLVTSMSAIQSSAPLPRPENRGDDNAVGAVKADEPQNDSNAIIVRISKDDSIDIEGVVYREIADLTVRLQQLRTAGGAETTVLVVGDGDATHGTAASILDAAYEAGIDHLRLAVTDDGSGNP